MDENTALLSRRRREATVINSRKVKVAQGAILVTITLERVAFYSLAANLVLFLNMHPYDWKSYNSMYALLYFFGISYLTSFLGGLLADTVLGRFKTLVLSLFVYLVGYVFLPLIPGKPPISGNITELVLPNICGQKEYNLTMLTSVELENSIGNESPFDEKCSGLILGVLALIAVGSGPFRSNIAPFGADQVRAEGQQASLTLFNWYYWCVNLGSLIALLAIAYVEQYDGFHIGYLASFVCLAVAAFVFLCGGCAYIYLPRTGSVLKNIFRVLCEACNVRKCCCEIRRNADPLDKPSSCLDYAKYRYGGTFQDATVDEVKKVMKVVCVFITLVPYWMVYFQMETTFLLQGLHMNLDLPGDNDSQITVDCSPQNKTNEDGTGGKHPKLVAAWFAVFDVVFVVILIPVFDRIIYPRLAKAGRPMGFVLRVSIGMVVAASAVLIAGIVEHFRLQSVYPNENSPCCRHIIVQNIETSPYEASQMSVFWQIPQYALIGLSEVFASIAALEFAYQMAPKAMKGIIMGLFYLSTGVGSLLGTASMFWFNGVWFGSYDGGNINCRVPCTGKDNHKVIDLKCHLDFYFYFLAGIEFAGFLFFLIVIRVCNIQKEMGVTEQKSQTAVKKPVPEGLRSPVSLQRQTSSDVSVT